MQGKEYLNILELLRKGWDKDAHCLPFDLICILKRLSGFGYGN